MPLHINMEKEKRNYLCGINLSFYPPTTTDEY